MDYNTEINGNTLHCNSFFPLLLSADVFRSLKALNGYTTFAGFYNFFSRRLYDDDYRYLVYQERGR